MIYVTGDTHGRQEKWLKEIHPVLSPGDTIIITGDFGVGFWSGKYFSEETFYDWISEQPYEVLFVCGNHENFDKLNSYKIENWNGGKVHKIRHNIIHLMRGEIYSIDGSSVLAFGGGYSLDKYRRQEGVSWWPQEMPSEEEYQNAENNLKKHNYSVDYIITHTAPIESIQYLSTNGDIGIKPIIEEELPLTSFLDNIQKSVTYKHFYFGHFHVSYPIWRNQTAVFSAVYELKTGKIVKEWKPHEDF